MSLPLRYTIEFTRGDAYQIVAAYVDSNNAAIDITSEVDIGFYIVDELNRTVLALTIGHGVSVNAPLGLIQINLTNTQTAALLSPTYRHYLRLNTTNETILVGPLKVSDP